MYQQILQRAKGPLLALAMFSGCVLALAPVGQPDLSAESGFSVSHLLDTVRSDMADAWRRLAGPLEGDSYELYATLGSGDSETMRRYYAQQGSDDLERVFSYR